MAHPSLTAPRLVNGKVHHLCETCTEWTPEDQLFTCVICETTWDMCQPCGKTERCLKCKAKEQPFCTTCLEFTTRSQLYTCPTCKKTERCQRCGEKWGCCKVKTIDELLADIGLKLDPTRTNIARLTGGPVTLKFGDFPQASDKPWGAKSRMPPVTASDMYKLVGDELYKLPESTPLPELRPGEEVAADHIRAALKFLRPEPYWYQSSRVHLELPDVKLDQPPPFDAESHTELIGEAIDAKDSKKLLELLQDKRTTTQHIRDSDRLGRGMCNALRLGVTDIALLKHLVYNFVVMETELVDVQFEDGRYPPFMLACNLCAADAVRVLLPKIASIASIMKGHKECTTSGKSHKKRNEIKRLLIHRIKELEKTTTFVPLIEQMD